jgi:pimeloyl-ACP methyl ester carboxylesterase
MSKAFDRDGLTLSYRDEGRGPVLIFQHGLGADASQPFEVVAGFEGFRQITLECRGHGASNLGPVGELSIATFADDVVALMDHLGIDSAHVGGISMGAAIAARLAVRHQARVLSLCLARPAWFDAAAPQNMAIFAVAAACMMSGGRDAFAVSEAFAVLKSQSPDNATSLLGQFDAPDLAMRADLLRAIALDGPGLSAADYASIGLPTLVLGHEQDAVHPLAMARDIATVVPESKLAQITPKSVDKAAYLNEFCTALAEFLSGEAA